MLKQVYEIDINGYIIEIYVAEFDEHGNSVEELAENIIAINLPGSQWIEGATQEEIDEMNKVEPSSPTQEERVDILENMILLMMEG